MNPRRLKIALTLPIFLFAATHVYAVTIQVETGRAKMAGAETTATEIAARETIRSKTIHTQTDDAPGMYVGAGIGRFTLKLKKLDDAGIATKSIESASSDAWAVFAGYKFNSYLSLEGTYIDFGEPSGNYHATSGNASGNYRVRVDGVSPNLVGTLPVGRIELFAKAGYYFYQIRTYLNVADGTIVESEFSRADLLYSAGVSMRATTNLNARFEYQRLNAENAPDSDALWFTANWRF